MKDILAILQSSLFVLIGAIAFICLTTVGCSAQRTEEQSLAALRELTKGGKLPAESVVEDIERRFSGTRTGTLAKLLRARIRFENKDFRGAAVVLNSDDFAKLTNIADYALWLRGQALSGDGDHAGAMLQYEMLVAQHPTSLRVRDARIRWAESAITFGRSAEVPAFLASLNEEHYAEALLHTARAYALAGNQTESTNFYRKAYLYGGTSPIGVEAEAKLKALGIDPISVDAEGSKVRADRLLSMGAASLAYDSYTTFIQRFPGDVTPEIHLNRISAAVKANNAMKAQTAFSAMPPSMEGRDQAYRDLINAYAKARLWPQARTAADEMRKSYPNSPLTVKAWVEAGYAARDAKNKGEENFFLRTALITYPESVEVAGAQFELAWQEHEAGNNARAAEMLIEHLARYAGKDSTNRGRAGYWSARNAEKAGRINEACVLYDALVYRYAANWYGHIGFERLNALRGRGQCQTTTTTAADPMVSQAAASLRSVSVAPETSGPREVERAEKSEQLSSTGLFDWSIEELKDAQRTAQNSPRINLSLAKHYRMRFDNVNALLSLAKSYPDYAQMFPEEMGQEEWDIFYPHMAWDQIKAWAKNRDLEIYLVAGLIRQESVFNPSARSPANAYGLMQLLLPTARMTARKNGTTAPLASASELYQPALNIELGTAYMKEQLDKFGRVEFMAVAYNAGPGRVPQWRARLPMEMDEFVEAIPFRETKGYVQGIIRNRAQYRRLYDENGNFKPNVGTKPLRGEIDTKPRDQFAAEFPEIKIAGDRASE